MFKKIYQDLFGKTCEKCICNKWICENKFDVLFEQKVLRKMVYTIEFVVKKKE